MGRQGFRWSWKGREVKKWETEGKVIQANASAGMAIEKMIARVVSMPGWLRDSRTDQGLPSIKKAFVMKSVKHIQKKA